MTLSLKKDENLREEKREMSDLTPVKMMDRRGVMVTRHIRRDKPAVQKSGIPSISSLFRKDDRFPGIWADSIKQRTAHLSKAERRDLMSTLNDDTFPALYALEVGHGGESPSAFDNFFNVVITECVKERDFAFLNNIAVFAYADEEPYPQHLLSQLISPVKGLMAYQPKDEPRVDFTHASDDELMRARALIAAVERLGFGGCINGEYNLYTGEGEGVHFVNDSLIELVAEGDCDRARRIANTAKKHGMWVGTDADVKELRGMFEAYDGTLDVLSDGIL